MCTVGRRDGLSKSIHLVGGLVFAAGEGIDFMFESFKTFNSVNQNNILFTDELKNCFGAFMCS